MTNRLHSSRDIDTRAAGVLKAVRSRLRNASYPALREITCEFAHGALILQGRVASYYQKQLAQEAVRKIDDIWQIINDIEVVAPFDSMRN